MENTRAYGCDEREADAADMPPLEGRVEVVSADRLTDDRTGAAYFTAIIVIDERELDKLAGRKLLPGAPAAERRLPISASRLRERFAGLCGRTKIPSTDQFRKFAQHHAMKLRSGVSGSIPFKASTGGSHSRHILAEQLGLMV